MNNNLRIAVAMATFSIIGTAQASIITIETGFSSLGSQVDAATYQSVVDAAIASPSAGYGSATPAIYDNISNQSTIGGSNSNIAFKSTVDFGVSGANAGTWEIRSGVDFGHGGAIFVDGVAQDFKSTDMWWAGSYGDPSQYFDITLNLAAGNHTLNLYGLEGCCDGGQQAQFKIGNGEFTTFSSNDNLAAVPEPEVYGMMLMGLGLIGFVAGRRKQTKA